MCMGRIMGESEPATVKGSTAFRYAYTQQRTPLLQSNPAMIRTRDPVRSKMINVSAALAEGEVRSDAALLHALNNPLNHHFLQLTPEL
jgi:hypothetical protein